MEEFMIKCIKELFLVITIGRISSYFNWLQNVLKVILLLVVHNLLNLGLEVVWTVE